MKNLGSVSNEKDVTTKEYVDGKANKMTVSLLSTGWSNKSQTVSVTGVTTSNIIIVSPAPYYINRYVSSRIRCVAQASNSLTFSCSTLPTDTLVVNVVILNY